MSMFDRIVEYASRQLENPAEEEMVEKLKAIKGVLRVRVIK